MHTHKVFLSIYCQTMLHCKQATKIYQKKNCPGYLHNYFNKKEKIKAFTKNWR